MKNPKSVILFALGFAVGFVVFALLVKEHLAQPTTLVIIGIAIFVIGVVWGIWQKNRAAKS